jgi:cyclophilin family peptidyl-prolyl cis-trans isomerase
MEARKQIFKGIISWLVVFVLVFFIVLLVLRFLSLRDRSLVILTLALSSVIVLVPWASQKTAQLIGSLAGKLFYSGEEFDRPQPMFSIPEGKRKNGHYQEAFDGFQKIANEYPQELKSYLAMIDIAIVDMKNKNIADTVFHQGIVALDDKEERDTLAKMYKVIGSRMDINLHAAHHPVELKKHVNDFSEPDYYR